MIGFGGSCVNILDCYVKTKLGGRLTGGCSGYEDNILLKLPQDQTWVKIELDLRMIYIV